MVKTVEPVDFEVIPKEAPTPLAMILSFLWQVLKVLASLRITVVLFTLSMILVFLGTLAMIDQGLLNVLNTYFRDFIVFIPFDLFRQFGQVFYEEITPTSAIPGKFPFPGGWLLGSAMMINLLAAHIVRFKLSWKRTGIITLHAGLIVLFMGEWVTGKYTVEGRMSIKEGEWANYTLHPDNPELAIIDSSDDRVDRVVVVPGSRLRDGAILQDENLPFDVEVKKFMLNSALSWVEGSRTRVQAEPVPEVSGTGSEMNMPSVVLTIKDKQSGAVLADNFVGSYLLTSARDGGKGKNLGYATIHNENQAVLIPLYPIRAGGQEYEVTLRMKRTYKPYQVYLKEFRFDRYMGTNKARNFSSEVRLKDEETGEDREVLIRMNEPMMHRGEAFYQSSFDSVTEQATVLQVVHDPGKPLPWLSLPYVGCILVSVGMCLHFGLNLRSFLERRDAS